MEDLRLNSLEELQAATLKGLRERLHKWIDMHKGLREESNNGDEEDKYLKATDMEKKKKKRNKRRLICVDYNADHTVSSLIVDDDLVVTQILSRLPAKSLMRFKCVCKRWKSIIQHDMHFIDLHHTHSEARPGFFIVVHGPYLTMSAELHRDGRGANIHTVQKIQSISYLKILGPVRGFICLVDMFAVQIHNVSTREATPWIKSTVFINLEKQNVIIKAYQEPKCYFGFDPSTGKHKVIFLWYETEFIMVEKKKKGKLKCLPVCEVLTVGDNTWRIIDDVLPCKPNGNISAYANGSIYWFMHNGVPSWKCPSDFDQEYSESDDQEYSESLMAFDIGSEKFRVIIIPNFTILEYAEHSCNGFLEMDGCLTVIRRRNHTVKMWKFHDYNKENGTSTISGEKDWTEVNIKLPSYISYNMDIFFHSIGKDQMILETYVNVPPSDMDEDMFDAFQRNVKVACFYSYNRMKKTFRKYKIKGISSIPANCSTGCSILVENILPVQKKLQHQ